jgi:hypothetical protein
MGGGGRTFPITELKRDFESTGTQILYYSPLTVIQSRILTFLHPMQFLLGGKSFTGEWGFLSDPLDIVVFAYIHVSL